MLQMYVQSLLCLSHCYIHQRSFRSAFENPDGSALKIDTDYFGKKRNKLNPTVGPFEESGNGKLKLKVW